MKVLVTGANGFVGRHLCDALLAAGHSVVASVRDDETAATMSDNVICRTTGELSPGIYWRGLMEDCDGIVHLAARTHVMNETADNPEMAYRKMNVEVTRRMSNEAALLGIKRVVLISSIKVNGERTGAQPFRADQPPAPEDAYGRTKRDAEIEMVRATERTATSSVVLRAPLVYGPGVKGNFLALMDAISNRKMLPLGMIDNRRSLVYVGNLVDAIVTAIEHPDAAGKTFLVRDGEDLSTSALCKRLARALGVSAKLLPVPIAMLRLAGKLTGKEGAVRRLTGSLQVDDTDIRDMLNWQPPFDVDEGLERTVAWFKSGADATNFAGPSKDPNAA